MWSWTHRNTSSPPLNLRRRAPHPFRRPKKVPRQSHATEAIPMPSPRLPQTSTKTPPDLPPAAQLNEKSLKKIAENPLTSRALRAKCWQYLYSVMYIYSPQDQGPPAGAKAKEGRCACDVAEMPDAELWCERGLFHGVFQLEFTVGDCAPRPAFSPWSC